MPALNGRGPGGRGTKGEAHLVTTYYLEMRAPGDLRRACEIPELRVREVESPRFRLNRALYRLVGREWNWTDRLDWPDEAWRRLVESENHRTWVAAFAGATAGYYELRRDADEAVEILYFGLVPGFTGRGLGGCLLTRAVDSAWAWGTPRRVWVHTCSLDHPGALRNYLSRGFTLCDVRRD